MGSKADASPDADNRKYELDIRLSKGHREIRDNIMAEGRTIWRQGILKIAGDGTGSNGRVLVPSSFGGEVHSVPPPPPPPSLQPSFTQQSQPPTSVVRWERFLHVRSLKVLLVEYDDSTRHVVSALLRNCSYEVSTAATGLEAWKFLEDLTNHIDLILSEVAMPSLSGIGLLSKIMSHRTRKHIPVIMMSSHDSMGIVFKCLSKGAVDFLVKPIRKNELKNLWQHVWRRCHSSSGSGSESGIRAHKSTNSVSGDESNTDSRSNGEDEDSSVRLNTRDGSDDGSGTQSSWTKTAIEVESPHPTSYQDHQSADPHDSTCAQVIHPKTETFCNEWMPIPESKSAHERDFVDDKSLAKDFERKVPTADATLDECFPNEKVDQNNITCSSMDIVNEKSKTDNQKLNLPQESMQITCETSVQATDVIGAIASTIKSQVLSKSSKASNNTPETLGSKEKVVNDETPFPSLELGLKRLISVGDDVTTSNDRNILRHSDQSAFSRYNVSVASSQIPTTLVGANKNASQSYLGSKNLNVFSRPPPLTEKSETVLAVKGSCLSAFHPAKLQPPGKEVQEKMDGIETGATVVHPNGIRVQVEHHHHHHHHHHIHGMQSPPQLQHPGEQEQYTLKNLVSAVPQCGSSNVFGGQIECNATNYSVNGSVSGSNHGSNFLNGSSAAANTVGLNPEDSGPAGKSGGEDNNGSGGGRSGSGTDHNRNAQREAALNKFRQKRKERCFEKKVRYQSRKKLADQRPRLRGQFVRQTTQEQRDQDDGC